MSEMHRLLLPGSVPDEDVQSPYIKFVAYIAWRNEQEDVHLYIEDFLQYDKVMEYKGEIKDKNEAFETAVPTTPEALGGPNVENKGRKPGLQIIFRMLEKSLRFIPGDIKIEQCANRIGWSNQEKWDYGSLNQAHSIKLTTCPGLMP